MVLMPRPGQKRYQVHGPKNCQRHNLCWERSHLNLSPNTVGGGGNGAIHMGLLNIIRGMFLMHKLSIPSRVSVFKPYEPAFRNFRHHPLST